MIQLNSNQPTAADLQSAIVAFTEELFCTVPTVTLESDPELPNSEYLVVHARTNAELAEILRLNTAWHVRLLEVAGDSAIHYRLDLDVA
ncbi:hypothetical protein NA78x_005464 [Anatilimnocola sp. NA78]|uniref:hypothetical protein n=1 Tax=Anatilimnocola sp. NA78 TaxID=3415683 RepID=UPI003CE4BFED